MSSACTVSVSHTLHVIHCPYSVTLLKLLEHELVLQPVKWPSCLRTLVLFVKSQL